MADRRLFLLVHGRAWRGREKREGEKGNSFEGSPTVEDNGNGWNFVVPDGRSCCSWGRSSGGASAT